MDIGVLLVLGFVGVVLILAFMRCAGAPKDREHLSPSAQGSDPSLERDPMSPYAADEPEREWLPGKGPRKQAVSIVDSLDDIAVVERIFRNVFAFSADKGESVVADRMKRDGCSRFDAMRKAISDRRRDETRWD